MSKNNSRRPQSTKRTASRGWTLTERAIGRGAGRGKTEPTRYDG